MSAYLCAVKQPCSASRMLFLRGTLLVSALVIAKTVAELENPCPSDWVQATFVDMGCLYFEQTEMLSREEAAAYCQTEQDANLVEIYTEEQFDYVQMNLELQELEGWAPGWWTGGTDMGREGDWIWIKSLNALPDLWVGPGGTTGTTRNCMLLTINNHGFFDYPCYNNYKFICQRKI